MYLVQIVNQQINNPHKMLLVYSVVTSPPTHATRVLTSIVQKIPRHDDRTGCVCVFSTLRLLQGKPERESPAAEAACVTLLHLSHTCFITSTISSSQTSQL